MHERDCSLVITDISVRDWSQPKVLESIRDCFVTGKWKASEDAQTLLREDDQCMYCNNNNTVLQAHFFQKSPFGDLQS